MNEPTPTNRPADANNPRLQAALEDYFERIDRRESIDRETFLQQHVEIADELRQFIATEDELRKLAADSFQDVSQISTGSFGQQPSETLPPRPSARAGKPTSGELSGRFGRYQILRTLGQGAMGTVYLAEDTQLLRQVALKTPQITDDSEQELLERFYREARAAATLRNPHICPVYDVGEIDGTYYITMAYIEGRSLSDFIKPAVPQSERQILIAVGKIAQALQAAHDRGIVHRDLKPANIMVDRQGEPVIMDFGLAQQSRPGEDLRLTQTGVILGSPAYMSPEQVEGDTKQVGPAADQYSLGVILFELLTGKAPFEGSLTSVLGQIVSKEPPPPSQFRPGLDPRIDAVCLKMMAKSPADRFPSLSAVAKELAEIVRDPGAKLGSKPPARRSWTPWAIAGAAAVGLVAGVVLYLRAGKTLLEIQIDDPGVQVALRGSTITLTGPANEEIKVEPGENELTITHGDLKFKTDAFTLQKGNKQVVKISLAGTSVAAQLGGTPLALTPLKSNTPVGRQSVAQPESTSPSAPQVATPTTGALPALFASGPALLVVPFGPLKAKTAQEAWADHLKVPVEMTNSIGIKLRLLPPGEYRMGATPGHHVRITRPCYYGLYEVTRGQFAQFVTATGVHTLAETMPGGVNLDNGAPPTKWEPNKRSTWRDPGFAQDDNHPVVQVAWQDATAFCDWLSRKEGKTYRLPTEAEWEYACRAGTITRTYQGSDFEGITQIANVADATAQAVFPKWPDCVKSSDGYVYTSPIGSFRPNSFGLYDTLGNVGEWCSDWYAEDFGKDASKDNPTGPALGDFHVGRGGGFTHVAGSRFRYYGNITFRRPDWGFRIACDIPVAAAKPQSAEVKSTKP
jgi:formylglycine-generating enzyme required for sulfatase activity/tRNA A-37 threonylcarbamoyl transferase component Bud32